MSELIDREALLDSVYKNLPMIPSMSGMTAEEMRLRIAVLIENAPTASPWHRVEDELPKEAGEYIVAYHPCWWNDVKTSVTEIGIDTFRGKTSWAKRKFQRVTHWMEKPEPPKEEA